VENKIHNTYLTANESRKKSKMLNVPWPFPHAFVKKRKKRKNHNSSTRGNQHQENQLSQQQHVATKDLKTRVNGAAEFLASRDDIHSVSPVKVYKTALLFFILLFIFEKTMAAVGEKKPP